jgi:WD40 repeat protein
MSRWEKAALGFAAALGVAGCVFLVVFLAGQGLERASLWAAVLGLPAGAVATATGVWALVLQRSKVLVPPEFEVPEWVVDRPAEAEQVVTALLRGRAGTVGITTGLYGAGGFGKTTLALMVCADRRVRRRFRGGVYLVTVGRDLLGGAAVAAKVNDVIKLVAGEEATFTDPELAGGRLGALLDTGPRRLLVVDDVWEQEQLAPFAAGGRRCVRLVTTRVPGLLAGRDVAVWVDQMSAEQARRLLTAGLPPLDPAVVEGLLAVTGRWPLLLRLVNKILVNAGSTGANAPAAGAELLERLRAGGPAVVDELMGEASRSLQVGQPAERARAVRATIEASTSLLGPQDAERFAELGVFAEDETIPFGLAARLWLACGDLDDLRASQLCARLAELALVSAAAPEAGGLVLHDVVRDFLRGEAGPQRLAALNGVLLEAVAAGLPAAGVPDSAGVGPARVAWWDLDGEDRYLWDHLIEHLVEAGRHDEAEAVASDLRWVGARVQGFGPAAPAADLSLVDTPRAARLRAVLARTAHLLAPTDPACAVVDVLHSRVATDPDWGPQVTALRDLCPRPRLVNSWPPPDLPDSALRRVLTGHAGQVTAVAIAPDGSWLASGSVDGAVRIWDAATGQSRATLTGRTDRMTAVAIAPDGSWLASGSVDGAVRIWDAATRQLRATLIGHENPVAAVAIAPDGSWLATGSDYGTVQIWDVATGQLRAILTGHAGRVAAVAIAPDGSWLATGGSDGTARIWDAATRQHRATLTGHAGVVTAVAIAPDGSWLATGSSDRAARIWDAATRQPQAMMRVENPILACVWHGTGKLAVGGPGGLFLFDFLTDKLPPSTGY